MHGTRMRGQGGRGSPQVGGRSSSYRHTGCSSERLQGWETKHPSMLQRLSGGGWKKATQPTFAIGTVRGAPSEPACGLALPQPCGGAPGVVPIPSTVLRRVPSHLQPQDVPRLSGAGARKDHARRQSQGLRAIPGPPAAQSACCPAPLLLCCDATRMWVRWTRHGLQVFSSRFTARTRCASS
jgi:hypothetical protein